MKTTLGTVSDRSLIVGELESIIVSELHDEIVSELPDEIITLIMLKLPAESLIRFKGVSKGWKHLISSHTFGHQWYKSSSVLSRGNFMVLRQTNVKICFTRLSVSFVDDGKRDKSDTFRLPYIPSGSGTCTDLDDEKREGRPLIYPAGFGFYCLFLFCTKKLALWNPTIRELKVLPWSPFNSKQKEQDEYVYGFAQVQYKEGVFSYKVGLMRHRYNVCSNIVMTIELYSSSERCWRRLKDCYILEHSSEFSSFLWPCKGTNLKGKFHFLNWFSRQDPCIVTFDMNTESFGRLEIPSFRHDSDCNLFFSVLTKIDESSLCLLLFRGLDGIQGGETYVDVWIMKEYGITESWTKKGTAGPITNPNYVDLLGYFNNGIEGVFFQSLEMGDGLLFCRYGSEKAETFLPINSEDVEIIQIVEHKESSIVSFNGTSDHRI
ncbi:hypothetical protein QQ045_031923 [Rhodiola kirilowii]